MSSKTRTKVLTMEESPLNKLESLRFKAYCEMTSSLQQVAEDFASKEKATALETALIKYDIGARLKHIVEREDVYGSNAVSQLSRYLGIAEGDLYACLSVARKFTQEQVEEAVSRQMSDGRHLSFQHLEHLALIKSERERQRFVEVAQVSAWSTRHLARELVAAGLIRA